MILLPVVLKITSQLPFPPERVMVQFVSAPVMVTVPVLTELAPLTLTLTDTGWPGVEGSGVSEIIVVVVVPIITVWLSISELGA